VASTTPEAFSNSAAPTDCRKFIPAASVTITVDCAQ
jgi:hypothetical protein